MLLEIVVSKQHATAEMQGDGVHFSNYKTLV